MDTERELPPMPPGPFHGLATPSEQWSKITGQGGNNSANLVFDGDFSLASMRGSRKALHWPSENYAAPKADGLFLQRVEKLSGHDESPTTGSLSSLITGSPDQDAEGYGRGLSLSPDTYESPWDGGSVSRLFSQSTCGDEFDLASLSHGRISVGDGHVREGPFTRCRLTAFLFALILASSVAVVVHLKWSTLTDSKLRKLEGQVDPGTAPYDGTSRPSGMASTQASTDLDITEQARGIFFAPAAGVTFGSREGGEEAGAAIDATRLNASKSLKAKRSGRMTRATAVTKSLKQSHLPWKTTLAHDGDNADVAPDVMSAPVHKPVSF